MLYKTTHMGRLSMNKRLMVVISLLPALIALLTLPAYSDQHKKDDVSALITEAQTRLNTVRTGSTADIVRSEISRIDESCDLSRRLLSDGKIDEAFNEMTLCNLYFQMIEARIELQKAILELDETKKNLSR
jgi:hypothetical protein